MKAWTVPAMCPVHKVEEAFGELGNATDKAGTDKGADAFMKEILRCIEEINKMKA